MKAKPPIDNIHVESLTMAPNGYKVGYLYLRDNGSIIGRFDATAENMQISPKSEELLGQLLESLEKDLHMFLFSEEAPIEQKENEKEEVTMEEFLGIKNPELIDEFDI